MWNNHLSLFWKRVGYRRLALALGLSLLLHFFLIGQFYSNVSDQNQQRQVIEAQLVLPEKQIKPEIKSLTLPEQSQQNTKKQAKPKKIKKTRPISKPVASAENSVEVAPTHIATTDETTITPTPATEIEPSLAEAQAEELIEEVDENAVEDSGLIINQNTYKYVETSFDVYSDLDPSLDNAPVGTAKVVYQQHPSSPQYSIKNVVQPKGLASIFVPELLQTSEGSIGDLGLQPKHYLYQLGDKKNKSYSADFDWEAKQLHLHNAKGDQTLELKEGAQDLLSFMYQFMFLQPLQSMQMSITNGKKLSIYTYSFEGEEAIDTKIGKVNAIHLTRASGASEKKTELWLALDYQYVPVKIRETDKEGKVYELIVSNLKTEPQ